MIKRYKHLADGIPKEISDQLMIDDGNGEWVKWWDVVNLVEMLNKTSRAIREFERLISVINHGY